MMAKRNLPKHYKLKNSRGFSPSIHDNNVICIEDDGNVICGKCVMQFKITKRDRITFAIQPKKNPTDSPNKPQKVQKKKSR